MFIYINALGYVFHFFVSRSLGPELYGEFMVLYSLMLTVGFLSSIYPSLTIKAVLENKENMYEVLRFLRVVSLLTGIVFFIGLIFSLPFIKSFLNLNHQFGLIIVGLVWSLMFLSNVEKGFLQSKEKFKEYSLINSIGLTLRLIFAIFLLKIGLSIYGALISSFIAIIIELFILLSINKNLIGKIKILPFKSILKTSFLSIPGGLYVYADDIFIKKIFDPTAAGLYASASLLGKMLIWLCLTLFSVVFVKIAEKKNSYKKYLIFSLFLIFLINIFTYIITILFGKALFLLLFGDKFLNAYQYLPYYILAVIPMIFNLVIFASNIVLERFKVYIYLNLFSYYAGFLIIKFNDVYDYILYIFIFHLISFLMNFYLFFNEIPKCSKEIKIATI